MERAAGLWQEVGRYASRVVKAISLDDRSIEEDIAAVVGLDALKARED